jgi:CheY-like chemotaxis protein
VVDDDEFNRLVLRRLLPSPPLTLAMAVNGRAALEAARADWPDVVLLDLEMPVMDGYEAAARLRELQKEKGGKPLRIAAISSNDDPATMRRALEAGCDHYLVKPAPRESLYRLLAGEAVEQDTLASPLPPAGDGPPPHRLQLDPQLRDTLPGFLDSRRKLLEDAAAAIAQADRVQLRRVAHRLAGSLALYGFQWASLKTRSVEDEAHVGDLAAMAGRLEAVREHLASVEISYRT